MESNDAGPHIAVGFRLPLHRSASARCAGARRRTRACGLGGRSNQLPLLLITAGVLAVMGVFIFYRVRGTR